MISGSVPEEYYEKTHALFSDSKAYSTGNKLDRMEADPAQPLPTRLATEPSIFSTSPHSRYEAAAFFWGGWSRSRRRNSRSGKRTTFSTTTNNNKFRTSERKTRAKRKGGNLQEHFIGSLQRNRERRRERRRGSSQYPRHNPGHLHHRAAATNLVML